MYRSYKSLSLNQNSSSKDSKAKQENMISQRNVKSLQDWKLPPSSASDAFKGKGIFCCFSPDRTVKTVEREIRLSEGISSVPLITANPRARDSALHVGMIQVALKPTELGSDTSAVICLRDKRLLKFNESVLGMVESSLSDGPIYFSYFPSHCVSMTDPHLKSTFVIDVKTQGCEAILMYRFHYKVMELGARDPKRTRSPVDEADGTTTLFVTEVARNNSVVSKKIYWDRVTVPEVWKVRSDSPSSSSAGGGEVAVGSAAVDWKEAAEAHVLKVDVPGLKREEIRVEVEAGGILQISGERRKEELEEDEKWRCAERSSGKFVRRLKLPENAELEEVKAAVENGVLTVTVPKMEVGKKPLVKVIDISG